MKIPKDGLRPSPVYEAHMSDGEVVRLSFYSPAGKSIDMAAGRRGVLACAGRPLNGDPLPDAKRAERDEAIQQANLRAAATGVTRDQNPGNEKLAKAYEARAAELEFLQSGGPERAASFFKNYPEPVILRAFVEHPSIGRVEHVPGEVSVKAKRKPAAKRPLEDRARAFAIMLVDEFSRDKIDAQLVASAIIGLREALQ